MSGETWVEQEQGFSDPSLTGAFVRGRRPLGRTTVLPTVDVDSGRPTVVHPRMARYEQDRELGRGGIGVVMGALDRDIGRRVAIKQIRSDVRSEKALLRFAEEVRTIGMLDHPNIVPIHDVGEDETGAPYFVMKYVEGTTLADILTRLREGDAEAHRRWTFPRRMEVFKKVLDAVAFAHEQGVVHRDLKPENIMIGRYGEVHVLDWGIAHRARLPDLTGLKGADPVSQRVTQTRDGAIMGTPAYMSPEQASGKPAGEASDVYSLGVVLYEWLTLTHYLSDCVELDEILEGVRTREARLAGELETSVQGRVPTELGWLVEGAMKKEPSERYPSVRAFIQALDGLADGDIPVHCPVTFQKHWLARIEHTIDRYPMQWMVGLSTAGIGLVLLACGLMGIAFLLGAVLV